MKLPVRNSEASVYTLDLPTSMQILLFPRILDCRANIHTKNIPAMTFYFCDNQSYQELVSPDHVKKISSTSTRNKPHHKAHSSHSTSLASPMASIIASPIASMTSQVKSFFPVCRDAMLPYKNTRTPRDHGKTWPMCRCHSSLQAEARRI